MKLKIKTNFSFGNLNSKVGKIIDDYLIGYVKDSAIGSKNAINNGLKPPLSSVTKKIRNKRNQPKSPPLKATGNLYNSIKQEDKSLTMVHYGIQHNKGFTTSSNSMIPNKKVPARPFIKTIAENKEKLNKKFLKDINQALKK